MVIADVAGCVFRPARRLPAIVDGRPRLGSAVGVVAVAGVVAAGVSAAATVVEPASDGRAAGIVLSAALPLLFGAAWVVDAVIVDAVARLMGCASRRRRYLAVSAFAMPVLVVYECVRLLQSMVDRAGGPATDTAASWLGLVEFAVIAWFIGVLTAMVRAVYGLPTLSALAAALAPSAAMATLLVVLLVVATALHGAGVI